MKFSQFLALVLASPVLAADPRGDNPDAAPSSALEQRAMFTVPPGFEVQLVADETQIQKPLNLNFDAAGRLWVTGSALYPWAAKVDALGEPIAGFDEVWKSTAGAFDASKAPAPPERAIDTVRVLSDFGPDGRARKVEVFAEGLNIPVGVQPLPRKPGAKGDSVIVFSIPTIWRLEDTDGDGRADKREALYNGFDFRDTHGMSSNYLYWIDGWIYGCHGFRNHSEVRDRAGRVTIFDSGNTYRFRPDGSQIEVYTHGQTNPFGLTVDPLGNFYSADSHSKPVMLLQRGGFYAGIGKNHDGLGFAPTITDDDHGSSAIAGIAYYADDKFPAEYRDNLFNGNPVTRRINRDKLEWHGSTPKAIRMPDFLTCDDPWFRPIQVKLGPDGALYIADFYNPIIGHYEFPLADPRRDSKHGRIWRVVWRGEKKDMPAAALPDLTKLDAAGLIAKLADPNLTVRTLATNELVDRVGKGAVLFLQERMRPALDDPTQSGATTVHGTAGQLIETPTEVDKPWSRIEIGERGARLALPLWAMERLGSLSTGALVERMSDSDWFVEKHATGIGGERLVWETSQAVAIVERVFADENLVRRAAVEALARHPRPENLDPLLRGIVSAPLSEPALSYATLSALRESLASPGAFAAITQSSEKHADYAEPEIVKILVDVSLAVKTPEAAEYLLGHLERTKCEGARSGDSLHHVVRYLPTEKLGAVAELFGPGQLDHPLPQRLALADALGLAARQRGWKLPDDLAAWTQHTMFAALDSPEAPISNRAIAALREVTWPEKFAPLQQIVLDPKQNSARRAAALEAALNLDRGPALAAQGLGDPTSLPLRKKAAELLGRTPSESARATLLAALPTAPAELALSITASLAKTDPDFSALLDLLESGKASPVPLRHRLIAILITQRTEALRARANALTKNLPPEDARLDQLIAERTKTFSSAKPDPARGAQVFAQNCAACHRFRNIGGNVGPNLDGVAARGPARLIEDILDPNRNVDPLFRQTTIETTSGEFHVGANLRDQGKTILLADTVGREVTIAKTAIKAQTGSLLSLMPPIYETALPSADFFDLLAYLLSPSAAP